MMRHITLCLVLLCQALVAFTQQSEYVLRSPDKKISVQFKLLNEKRPVYNIRYGNMQVLQDSRLGLVREDADFSTGLSLISASRPEPVKDTYRSLNAKKANCSYQATRQVFHLQNASGEKMDVIFQVSNDGVAFRYHFPDRSTAIKRISKEVSSFHFVEGTKAFLQPMSEAKTGWSRVNPCYEEFYQKGIDAGVSSPTKAGWVYPALFNAGSNWVLITEAALDRNYCGTRLAQHSPNREYSIDFPQEQEGFPGGIVNPESALPWYTPWRVIAVGSLKTIVESTLGTDLALPAVSIDQSFIKPGQASWSWAILKDDSIVYDVQKRFVDYASSMKWEYCLVDVNWDTKIGYEKIKELADYAQTKKVGLILWYNSSGDWNDTQYTPKSKLLTHEDRVKEFSRLSEMGISVVKIDFFGGDGQSVIAYYLDILEDAAKYNLLVNFHGSTIPRGWHRTYPNLMTMEAIKGFEYVTFEQVNADEEPSHCTVLPFTRNAFDPMDFTPLSLYKIPRIQRRTTNGFELALSVLFLSGIQHFAETPRGMDHVPAYVKDFLRGIPGYWDDVHFIDGYPGKFVVIARKSGDTWYVAGINGEPIEKNVTMDLSFIAKGMKGTLIADGNEDLSFEKKDVNIPKSGKMELNLKKNGGFVMTFGK